ncbi:MAG: S8 family serine peptidase, partial [Candidatus Aenigmarchaeota archaeon]|nr:S8 family serine peptidase [Candidatus Aenigmarchaeota archaeon]
MDKASKLLAAILMISILSPAFAAEYIIEPPQIPPERQLQAFSESSSPEPLKPGLRRIYGTDSLAGSLTEEEAAELEAQGYTLYENFRVYGFLDESAAIINATEVWAVQVGGINLTGAGQTICVIDSGINYTHSAFGGSWGSVVLGGAAFLNDSGYVAECNETNSTPCFDNNGHGTKLAGILVSQDATYRGIAPDAKLVVVKALEGEYNSISSGYESDIASGVNYCTEHSAEYNISVISLSLGSTGKSSYYCDNEPWVWPGLRDAIDNATAHGIMVVAAAGNNYSTTNLSAPACFYNATPVGAVDKLDAIPAFSNRWELPLVFAPGQNIMTSYWPGGFAYASGTSMAAPHLSGVFALMKQYLSLVGGNLTPQELETRAIYTGTNVTSNANMSRINAYELYLNLSEYLFVVVSAPLNHSIQNSSVLSVSGSSSRSGTNVSVYYTNGTLADSTNLSGLYWSANFTLSDGAYNIVALISNGTNSENVTVSNITLDTVPPQVEIVSPLPSVYLPSKTVLINLTANDTNLNYTNISIYNSTGGLVNSTTK